MAGCPYLLSFFFARGAGPVAAGEDGRRTEENNEGYERTGGERRGLEEEGKRGEGLLEKIKEQSGVRVS